MRYSFSHLLLITSVLFSVSCRTTAIQSGVRTANLSVSAETSQPDSGIIRLYAPYKQALDAEMNRVISYSVAAMEKDKPESLLSNFLADLLLEEAKAMAPAIDPGIDPAVSYMNYGGIRTWLPQGNITVGKVFELMPFENELVYIQISGSVMQQFLDEIAARGGDAISGVRFKISNAKATQVVIGGKELDRDKLYWLATNDYIANGGDNMQMLRQNSRYIPGGKLLRDILMDYLEKKQSRNEKITATMDGRISYE